MQRNYWRFCSRLTFRYGSHVSSERGNFALVNIRDPYQSTTAKVAGTFKTR